MTKRIWLLSTALVLGQCLCLAAITHAASGTHVVHFYQGHGSSHTATQIGIGAICNEDGTVEFDIINRSALTATGNYTLTAASGTVLDTHAFTVIAGGVASTVLDPAPFASILSITYALPDGTTGSAQIQNQCTPLPTVTAVPSATATPPGGGSPGQTPELGSGELLASGLIPLLGLAALGWRRRRGR